MPVSPLYDDTNGDIVLQTSDGFRSRVDSIRRGGASDLFRDLLRDDVSMSDEKTVDGLTLIKVSETSEGFGPFLCFTQKAQPGVQPLSLEAAKRFALRRLRPTLQLMPNC
jgi:hypothetical protein